MKRKTYPKLIEHLPLSFKILIYTFVKRLHSGKNCLVAIVGGTGSGKSLSSVCILYWTYVYMHGKPPTVEDSKAHWFFKTQDFLKRMNNPELTKGELNLWDEMGVSASHKSHQSIQNKAISWLVQTFRNLEQLVIFTVPTTMFIDKSVRNLLHFQLETRTILKSKKICIIKPLKLQYNMRMDKMYYHNLFYPSEEEKGMYNEVDVVGIPLPPKELDDSYEEMAGEFKKELNLKIQMMIEKADLSEEIKKLTGNEAAYERLTNRQKEIYDVIKQKPIQQKDLAEHFGMSNSAISQHLNAMRRRGIDFDEFAKKNEVLSTLKLFGVPNNLTSNGDDDDEKKRPKAQIMSSLSQ